MKRKVQITNLDADLYVEIKKSKINASKVCAQILTKAVDLAEQDLEPEFISGKKLKKRLSFTLNETLYMRVKAEKLNVTNICRRALARAVRVLEQSK